MPMLNRHSKCGLEKRRMRIGQLPLKSKLHSVPQVSSATIAWFQYLRKQVSLIVKVNYAYRVMYIRFLGTHAQYDRINVEEV